MEKQRDKAAQRQARKLNRQERQPGESPYEIGEPSTAELEQLPGE